MKTFDQCPICRKKFGKLFGAQQTPEDLIEKLGKKIAIQKVCASIAQELFS